MIAQNKRLAGILLSVVLLLLVPLVAMQFTEEVNWTLSDFLVAAILLLTPALLIELVMRKVQSTGFRIAIGMVILMVAFLVWVELSVGILGTPFAGS